MVDWKLSLYGGSKTCLNELFSQQKHFLLENSLNDWICISDQALMYCNISSLLLVDIHEFKFIVLDWLLTILAGEVACSY